MATPLNVALATRAVSSTSSVCSTSIVRAVGGLTSIALAVLVSSSAQEVVGGACEADIASIVGASAHLAVNCKVQACDELSLQPGFEHGEEAYSLDAKVGMLPSWPLLFWSLPWFMMLPLLVRASAQLIKKAKSAYFGVVGVDSCWGKGRERATRRRGSL